MEEKLIEFNTAKLAKEKGFKEMCFAAFHKDNSGNHSKTGYFESGIISQSEYFKFPEMSNGDKIVVLQKDYIHTILRPTQSFLQKWLREVHKIHIDVEREENMWKYELYEFSKGNKHIPKGFSIFKTYEEALEEGLFQTLKLIKDE